VIAVSRSYLPPPVTTSLKTNDANVANTPKTNLIENVRKEFYIFTAPEETNTPIRRTAKTIQSSPIVQRRNIVFIQPPTVTENKLVTSPLPLTPQRVKSLSSSIQPPTLPIAKQIVNTQVLTQQPQVQQIQKVQRVQQSIQQQAPSRVSSTPPEVHFLKYKTEADAKQIQNNILKQHGFSSLEKTSVVQNKGQPLNLRAQGLPQQQRVASRANSAAPNVHFFKVNSEAEANQLIDNILKKYGFTQTTTSTLQVNPLQTTVLPSNSQPARQPNALKNQQWSQQKWSSTQVNSSPPEVNFVKLNTPSVNSLNVGVQEIASNDISLPNVSNLQNIAVDKNYARNYLPPGKDVLPGTSYLPLR